MIRIQFTIPITAGAADLFYVPAPARGIVKAAKFIYNEETDLDETISVMRGTDVVNLGTPPADTTAEGVSFEGVPDTANKDLIFDPESTTVANRALRLSVPATFDTDGIMGIDLQFDDGAAVTQTPLEA
ncbi:MAG TPA: hypothetical protein ENH07_10400 [Nitrospirae bacterium]|nr:hypothetical protein [Nitrospirota bacterium]